VPALENIWADSLGQSMAAFNFRTVTSKFNELVYQYPIRRIQEYTQSLAVRLADERARPYSTRLYWRRELVAECVITCISCTASGH